MMHTLSLQKFKSKLAIKNGKYWACFFLCIFPFFFSASSKENTQPSSSNLYVSEGAILYISNDVQVVELNDFKTEKISKQNHSSSKSIEHLVKLKGGKNNSKKVKEVSKNSTSTSSQFCYKPIRSSNRFFNQNEIKDANFYNPTIQSINVVKSKWEPKIYSITKTPTQEIYYESVKLRQQYYFYIQSRPPPVFFFYGNTI